MTDPLAFALAVLALLATPGPTNTLLAASGAGAGLRRSARLIPAEIGGYLLAILSVMALVGPALTPGSHARTALELAAGAWLALSAVRLWREAGSGFSGAPSPIGPARVFVTTLLNPKALVFAVVVFPAGPAGAVAAASLLFAALVAVVGTGWILVGRALANGRMPVLAPRSIHRAAALVLAAFASMAAGSAFAGIL